MREAVAIALKRAFSIHEMMTTQIHPSLKRLIQQHFEPAFGGMSFPPGSDGPNQTFTGTGSPIWALPPAPLLPFHSTFLMNQLWRRLLKVIATPAKIVRLTPSWQAVQVTGCAVFVEGPSHEIQVLLWDPAGGAQPLLHGMESHRVILTETPYRILWLQRLGELAAAEVCEYHRHRDRLIPLGTAASYSKWIFEQFAHALPKHVDLRRLRQQCAQALNLRPDHVRVAHRLAFIGIAKGKATFADYNKAVRHADAMADLNQDAPTLVPLLGVLNDEPDFPAHGEVTAKIKNYLTAMGLSGYVWRLLLRASQRLLVPMREFYTGTKAGSVVDFLRILDRLRAEPEDLLGPMRLLFTEFGHADSRREGYWPRMEQHQAAFAHLLKAIRRMPVAERPSEEQIATAVRWIVSCGVSGWNRVQRQGGWSFLYSTACAWEEIEVLKLRGRFVDWSVPFDLVTWNGWAFRALASGAALVLEGRVMRNCVAHYATQCKTDEVLLVAVSNAVGKRLATASYQQQGTSWKLIAAMGPANRELSPRVKKLIRQFAAKIPDGHEIAMAAEGAVAAQANAVFTYYTSAEVIGLPDPTSPNYIGTYTPPAPYTVAGLSHGEIPTTSTTLPPDR